MALYISAERLKTAVDRLRQSRASGGMVNFLILKRAIVLAAGGKIKLSIRDENFQQAITELTWWPADGIAGEPRPFIDVFGSVNAKNHGMKKQKYRSNGPADTLKNGAWNQVVAVTDGDRSKVASLKSNYRQGLSEMTLLKDERRPMPKLYDAAVWYFRKRDVEPLVLATNDAEKIEQKLAEAFCHELDLKDKDLEALFATENKNAD